MAWTLSSRDGVNFSIKKVFFVCNYDFDKEKFERGQDMKLAQFFKVGKPSVGIVFCKGVRYLFTRAQN